MSSASRPMPTGAVTFLFTDIEGSTRLWETDPDSMREALTVHDRIIEGSVGEHDGVVFKTGGDSFCASFGSPHLAVEAAIEAQRQLGATHWETQPPITVRMGLHTGTAQVRNDDYFGPTLNRTARLMEAGHGGQVLISSTTQSLLIDELPPGVGLLSLGSQYLKDLDRPETIFQLTADGLDVDLPPLRTSSTVSLFPAEQVKAAYKAKKWSQVHELISDLEVDHELTGEQHEMMGFALWSLGEDQEIVPRFEMTHGAYVAEGNPQGAALAALQLAELHSHNLAEGNAEGWVRRAERLLTDDRDSVAKGYLLRWQSHEAFDADGDLDSALQLSRRVGEIAKINLDGSLEVLALLDQGRFLVASGRLDEGMPLMDEAMIGVVAGDVNPMVVGRSYCNMIGVCNQTGDVRRAAEWSEAAERWCRDSETLSYPGMCRIHKAEVMWRNGDWVGAESEVMRASTELGLYTDISGEAWYQFGEMRLRAGDYDGAENAFQEALTRGREPVPGYALILAYRDDPQSAVDLLERTLSEPRLSKLDRARFLPALIQLSLQQGDLEKADEACSELAEIGEIARSDLFTAQAAQARGNIELASGNPSAASGPLKDSIRAYTHLGLPFDSAHAHADLSQVYAADDAPALATMELKAAKAEFDRLGSKDNAAEMDRLLNSVST